MVRLTGRAFVVKQPGVVSKGEIGPYRGQKCGVEAFSPLPKNYLEGPKIEKINFLLDDLKIKTFPHTRQTHSRLKC